MLKVGLIGVGNTGNQVAVLANQLLNVPVLAVNSSEKDLETVPNNIPKKLISDSEGLSHGAGKNRTLAKSYLKDSIMSIISSDDINDFILSQDVIFIVSSTGGGTGSGVSPLLSSILSAAYPDVKIILVGVLPVSNEALSSHVNTLEYLNELYTSLSNQTYMLYDNDTLSDIPSYQMMDRVNMEIVKDIDVIRCTYNYTTKYDSIDEQDMMRLISFPGRLMVTRLDDIKEKDVDKCSIEDMMLKVMKNNQHVESQRDKKVTATGIIVNLSEVLSSTFDNHIPTVCDFIGSSDHDFNHIHINEDRKMPNKVLFITSGLSPINDRINKISDRIEEIEERQRIRDEENAMHDINVSDLSSKILNKEVNKKDVDEVNIKGIFSQFGI